MWGDWQANIDCPLRTTTEAALGRAGQGRQRVGIPRGSKLNQLLASPLHSPWVWQEPWRQTEQPSVRQTTKAQTWSGEGSRNEAVYQPCVYVYTCVCVYVGMCVRMYVCMFLCVLMYLWGGVWAHLIPKMDDTWLVRSAQGLFHPNQREDQVFLLDSTVVHSFLLLDTVSLSSSFARFPSLTHIHSFLSNTHWHTHTPFRAEIAG